MQQLTSRSAKSRAQRRTRSTPPSWCVCVGSRFVVVMRCECNQLQTHTLNNLFRHNPPRYRDCVRGASRSLQRNSPRNSLRNSPTMMTMTALSPAHLHRVGGSEPRRREKKGAKRQPQNLRRRLRGSRLDESGAVRRRTRAHQHPKRARWSHRPLIPPTANSFN
jgi:hypothetical protein